MATTTAAAAAAAKTTTVAAAAASGAASGVTGTIAGANFGLCVPTMKFESGIANRGPEFTFQLIDPLAAKGQQEALNPSALNPPSATFAITTNKLFPDIITNRICDQLINVCQANAAAHTLCKNVQAQVLALGTRNKSTADFWNTAMGFPGTITNPDGGPAEPPAKKRMARAFQA